MEAGRGAEQPPSADSWPPGAAGLVLHTIVAHPTDPRRIWVGISAAGVFSTEDGSVTWERRNRLSNANACEGHDHPAAPRDGETGHCAHNMVRAGRRRCTFPAEPPQGLALERWRTQLGRHKRRPAFDFRVSDPGTSPRPRDGLDAAAQRRHGGPLSSRCKRSGMADVRRGRVMADPAQGPAAEELLFHRAPSGDGGRCARTGRNLFRYQFGFGLCQPRRGGSWTEIAQHLPTILSVKVPWTGLGHSIVFQLAKCEHAIEGNALDAAKTIPVIERFPAQAFLRLLRKHGTSEGLIPPAGTPRIPASAAVRFTRRIRAGKEPMHMQ